jgi:deoxycytidine triphosphate deaminase
VSERALSVLSDGTILQLVEEGRITIDPWDAGLVQPASVDLRLGDSFRVFHNYRVSTIDLREPPENLTEEVVVQRDDAFVIHPGEFALGRTLEWVELPDDIVARIEGKALALDTPVPTPDGWRTMGELEAGDWVLDLRGRPTPVVDASETMVGHPCREVRFSGEARVVADVDHLWQVWVEHDRGGRLRVMTTGQIQQGLGNGTRYWVPAAGPVLEAAPALTATLGEKTHMACKTSQGSRRRGLERALPGGGVVPARAIASVRQCESVPVCCIQVGSADGVFLVSRSFIPTHNSSLGRLGLIVHATAGFCDPGWRGTLTLELNNLTRVPIKLYPGLPIAQLSFMTLDRPAQRPYGSPGLGSHYQGQRSATESRYEGARGGRIE